LAAALVFCAAALMGACKRESASTSPVPSSGPTYSRGQVVVVEQSAAAFAETRVLEVAGGRLRVDSPEGGDSQWIPSADVYALGRAPSLRVGALVICRHRTTWLPCKVEETSAGRVRARDAHGRELELAAEAVIEPRPVTELNLKRHFERAAERDEFLAALARAGKPPKPPGWLPPPRSRVIAAREGQWYSAQIHEFDEEVPRVSFVLDGRITELSVADLAPEPPYDVSGLRRGDFVLRRPPGPTEAWKPVQIRSLGDKELRVADVNGELTTVSVRDVVPLSVVSADR
jgi:hypothetical protein